MTSPPHSLRVLVVGSGGREHALAWACARSPLVGEVLAAPGNGGTATVGRNLQLSVTDGVAIARAALEARVDLVVVGPDAAIAAGVTDAMEQAGILCFGARRLAGELESSKAFAKRLMSRVGIDTAAFGVFHEVDAARRHILSHPGPVVVKADGLALGKGAFVCPDSEVALQVTERLMVRGELGDPGRTVVIEEVLDGTEVSLFAICDGQRAVMLPPVCDYKRAFDGDLGDMTGGMGGYCPPRGLDVEAINQRALEEVVTPVLAEMSRLRRPFQGCLYVGAMLSGTRIQVLEFNARFGDPETEIVLPLLGDPVPYLLQAAQGALELPAPALLEPAAVGVVAVREPYPQAVSKGGPIEGLAEAARAGCLVFQMGTLAGAEGAVEVAGGRVLICMAAGESVARARSRAYSGLERLSFAGMRYRSDIAA